MKTLFKKIALVFSILFIGAQVFAQDSCNYFIDYYQDQNNPLEFVLYINGEVDSSDVATWDFGDGSNGTGLYLTHTFPGFGSYTVTASINSVLCGMITITTEIVIDTNYVPVDCSLDFSYQVGDNYNVSLWGFGDGYDDFSSWSWYMGDSVFVSGQNISYQFPAPGQYPVTLTATNAECGSMTVTDIVYVYDQDSSECDAYFWYAIDSTNFQTVYFFSNNNGVDSSATYVWDFGDGTTEMGFYPVHTYSQDGQYLVTLTVDNGDCSATYSAWVWVGDDNNWYPDNCQALFYADYSSTGYNVDFYDISWSDNAQIINWFWNFGDSTFSSNQNPSHVYTQSGEYEVSLTIYTTNCSSTFTEIVYIEENSSNGYCQAFFYPVFDGSLSVHFYDLTMPTPNNWAWEFGDGTTSTLQNPVYTYNETGVYTVTLVTGDSCMSAFAMDIYLYEDTLAKSTAYIGEILQAYAVQIESLDIQSVENEVSLNIYPNPVADLLNVDFGQNAENAQIFIYNINGQIVYSATAENKKIFSINTSEFSNGVYIMKVIQGEKVNSVKFVK
ncbi:MAG: PKD domain-containing protein [Bacteroidales bacterium]|nr:PKD domain-containing protein [Bacteroidales bacterium]